jgi:hypothetical protein
VVGVAGIGCGGDVFVAADPSDGMMLESGWGYRYVMAVLGGPVNIAAALRRQPATHAAPSPPLGADSSAIVRIGIFGRGRAGLLGAGHRVSLPAVTRNGPGPGAARPSGSPYPDPHITAGRLTPEEAWPD